MVAIRRVTDGSLRSARFSRVRGRMIACSPVLTRPVGTGGMPSMLTSRASARVAGPIRAIPWSSLRPTPPWPRWEDRRYCRHTLATPRATPTGSLTSTILSVSPAARPLVGSVGTRTSRLQRGRPDADQEHFQWKDEPIACSIGSGTRSIGVAQRAPARSACAAAVSWSQSVPRGMGYQDRSAARLRLLHLLERTGPPRPALARARGRGGLLRLGRSHPHLLRPS